MIFPDREPLFQTKKVFNMVFLRKTTKTCRIFFNLLRSFVKNDYFCTRIQKSIHLRVIYTL
jgi:hypothetical protein